MFILASHSPRRREILQMAGYTFEIESPTLDERKIIDSALREGLSFENTVCRLAEEKAQDVRHKVPDACIVASDTVVISDGRMLGKPENTEDAYRMLRHLLGKTHQVITAVCLLDPERGEKVFSSQTRVRFYPESPFILKFIREYVDSGDPLDKAGAYAAQGATAILIESMEGDFHTVMGLPIGKLAQELAEWGIVPELSARR